MSARQVLEAHSHDGHRLYVAGRGINSEAGLHLFRYIDDDWRGVQLASVNHLNALAHHPQLPIVYGVSGEGHLGTVLAWNVHHDESVQIAKRSSGGEDPCHVEVHPLGHMLVVSNYTSGNVAVWSLAENGDLLGEPDLVALDTRSVDPNRQRSAHPHQTTVVNDQWYVVDLGGDAIHILSARECGLAGRALAALFQVPVPAGTGPRHLAVLNGGGIALSGELSSTVLTGHWEDQAPRWLTSPSTQIDGPARTRGIRNYPGDIQSSLDGRHVYVANRGHDTVAAFEVGSGPARLVAEVDAGVAWPQHLLVMRDQLVVAGEDSSAVVALPLTNGLPGPPRHLFDCAGAAWLLQARH